MKFVPFFIFLLIIDIYFYLGTAFSVNKLTGNPNLYKIFYWILSGLIYSGIIYVILTYEKTTPSVRFNNSITYSSFIFIIFIAKFIGLFPLILDDAIRLFKIIFNFFGVSSSNYDSSRTDFLRKSALVISATIFSTLLYGMLFGRYNFKKNFKDIFINNWPKLKSEYKIIHISDLHLGSFNSVEQLEEVVFLINEEKPNLVVFTGDLVNNYYSEAVPYVNTLKKIKAKDGKFAVLGNHDYCDYVGWDRASQKWKDNFNNLIDLEKKCGFDLLLNESRVINIGSSKINIVGVENWGAGKFNKDGNLEIAMQGVNNELPTILLSHDPSHWRQKVLKSKYRIDLQLSGHTHGMQFGIEIPHFKWSPAKYRYKEWAGLYKSNESQIYVNRGLGHLGYAGRVGIMPDISVLNIKTV
tara:strand:- start:7860 stop:9092 length:1233 start_codon:yes stop_codon:yes gene_type:complete